jgi:hypothetical protein
MQRTGTAWLLLACTILVVGCNKQDSPMAPNAAAGKAAVAPDSASGKKDSVFVDGVSFTVVDGPAGGKELRYEGTLHNNSGNPVDGVELSISLVNASKASIGGQVTQYFFQPSVQPQGSQAMLVQVPALKVKDDFSALSAQITVSQVLKAQPATVTAPPPTSAVSPAAPLPATGEAATPGAATEPSKVAPAGAESSK